jgi:hypothetical protein
MNTKEKTDQGFGTHSSNNILLFYSSLPKIVYQSSTMSIYLANNAPTREISIQNRSTFLYCRLPRRATCSTFFNIVFLFLLFFSFNSVLMMYGPNTQPAKRTIMQVIMCMYEYVGVVRSV